MLIGIFPTLAAPRLAVLEKLVIGEGEDNNEFGMTYN